MSIVLSTRLHTMTRPRSEFTHGGLPRKSVNLLRLISELEGCYQLTKYMAFDEDNAIIDEMKQRYYKLYFKLKKEESTPN